MPNFLPSLAPLSGGAAPGLTSESYQQFRTRQALADKLAQGAADPI